MVWILSPHGVVPVSSTVNPIRVGGTGVSLGRGRLHGPSGAGGGASAGDVQWGRLGGSAFPLLHVHVDCHIVGMRQEKDTFKRMKKREEYTYTLCVFLSFLHPLECVLFLLRLCARTSGRSPPALLQGVFPGVLS